MIDELDVDGAGGFTELAGDVQIGGAGRGIAAGVIVHADDGAGGFADGGAENFAWVGEGGGGTAGGNFYALEEAVFAVEAEDPEFFHVEAGDERAEVGGDEIGAVEEGSLAGLLADDAVRDLHHGNELEGFHVADSLQAAEIFFSPGDETGERTGFGDKTAGEGEHVLAAGAAAEKHGEEFGVAEGAGAVFFETLLGAFARGSFAEAVR